MKIHDNFAVAANTTAAAIIAAASTVRTKLVLLSNLGSDLAYFGKQGVTTATGTPIAVNAQVVVETQDPSAVYVVSAGNSDIRVMLMLGEEQELCSLPRGTAAAVV